MRERRRADQISREQATEQWQKAQEQLDRLSGQLAALQQQQQQQSERLQQAEQTWQQALASSEFADEFAFSSALLDDAQRQQLQQRKERLQQRRVEASALLAQATQTLELHRQTRPEGVDEVRSDAKALSQSLAELAQQLKARCNSGRGKCVTNWKATPLGTSISNRCLSKSTKASSSTMTGASLIS